MRERAHDADMRGRLAEHCLRLLPYRDDLVRFIIDRYHRGLVDNDASTAYIDKGVRGPEINRDIIAEK